ncbi:MAG: hypothetical protein ACKV2O_13790 [Acidimicrobiales bacterium]
MASKTVNFDTPFRKGDSVRATEDLAGVPVGTTGKVKLVNGLTWTRYWVFFDNGTDLGSIDQKALVRSKQWDDYQRHREEQTAAAAVAAASAKVEAPVAAAEEAPSKAASRVPAHLLERAKKRQEAKGG